MKKASTSNIKKNIFLVLFSVIGTVLLAEFAVTALDSLHFFPTFFSRINSWAPPWHTKHGPGLYYAHPYTSYATKPKYQSANNRVNINKLGFRGAEYSKEKPNDIFRIVALGASTTYGISVRDEFTYPYLLEHELQRILSTDRIQVINAGLVSATTAETLHRLFTDILPISPDMIVIYHGFNDLMPRIFNDFSEDYYAFRKIRADKKMLLGRSYLYRIVLISLSPKSFWDNVNLLRYTWKLENLPEADELKVSNFEGNSSATFENNLRHIIYVARSNSMDIVLSTFAIDKDAPHWNSYMPDELWSRGVNENNSVIRNVADDYKIPLIDFYTYALKDKNMFDDSIHMNEYGNKKKAIFFSGHIAPLVENVR